MSSLVQLFVEKGIVQQEGSDKVVDGSLKRARNRCATAQYLPQDQPQCKNVSGAIDVNSLADRASVDSNDNLSLSCRG